MAGAGAGALWLGPNHLALQRVKWLARLLATSQHPGRRCVVLLEQLQVATAAAATTASTSRTMASWGVIGPASGRAAASPP